MFLFSAGVSARFGCMPQPDPWFVRTSVAAPSAPAPEVEMQPLTPDGERWMIRNSSTTPLYLLQPLFGRSEPRLRDPNLPLPDNFGTNVKIVADEVIVMDVWGRWRPLRELTDAEWFKTGTGDRTFELHRTGEYFPNLDPPIPYGDNRPPNVQVPQPTHVDLHMLYGDQLIVTPMITTTYALNPSYDPQSVANGADRCARANGFLALSFGLMYVIPLLPLIIAIFCFMLAILFLMYAIGRYRRLD
jgi:hypothetical protein